MSLCIINKTYSHLMQLVFVFTCIRLSNVINVVVVRKRQLTLTLTSPSKFMNLTGLCCTRDDVLYIRIGGSVVECSPATREARVRFPADAMFLFLKVQQQYPLCKLYSVVFTLFYEGHPISSDNDPMKQILFL